MKTVFNSIEFLNKKSSQSRHKIRPVRLQPKKLSNGGLRLRHIGSSSRLHTVPEPQVPAHGDAGIEGLDAEVHRAVHVAQIRQLDPEQGRVTISPFAY